MPVRAGQQCHGQLLADLTPQGLQVALGAFALAAGDVEDILPARPRAQDRPFSRCTQATVSIITRPAVAETFAHYNKPVTITAP